MNDWNLGVSRRIPRHTERYFLFVLDWTSEHCARIAWKAARSNKAAILFFFETYEDDNDEKRPFEKSWICTVIRSFLQGIGLSITPIITGAEITCLVKGDTKKSETENWIFINSLGVSTFSSFNFWLVSEDLSNLPMTLEVTNWTMLMKKG